MIPDARSADVPGLELVCVSYLAAAQVLTVERYPAPDTGAAVLERTSSVAGDGPLVALAAVRLGLRVGLVTNPVGADADGTTTRGLLDAAGVVHRVVTRAEVATPRVTVIADRRATRTWFADLGDAPDATGQADLDLLDQAPAVYLDGYGLIATAATRALRTLIGRNVRVVLNLGGDPPDPELIAVTEPRPVAMVQTSSPHPDLDAAEALATTIAAQFRTDVAVVTCGSAGAVARTREGHILRAPAPLTRVLHTHGAGAAFSAGYLTSLLRQPAGNDPGDVDTIRTALARGIAVATTHITRPSDAYHPSARDHVRPPFPTGATP